MLTTNLRLFYLTLALAVLAWAHVIISYPY